MRLDEVVRHEFRVLAFGDVQQRRHKVIFTDEWGGGTRRAAARRDPPTWGANAIFDIVESQAAHSRGYYKLPAPQTDQENCVAHNGSLIPVPGRDIMVQAWYQGGMSVFDFTDAAKPFEIAYFDRGPLDATQLITGGYWSAYWYNGYIYGVGDRARARCLQADGRAQFLSQNEINAASWRTSTISIRSSSAAITWPAMLWCRARMSISWCAARRSIAQRAASIRTALNRVDELRTGQERNARAVLDELDRLAAQLEADAASAPVASDATRLRSLAGSMTAVTARLRR